MTKHTREKWAERAREWRASGKSAEDFTEGKDYEASSLRWAVSQLGREEPTAAAPPPKTPRSRRAAARSVAPSPRPQRSAAPSPRAPRFMPVRMRRSEATGAEMIVEVGGARIRVTRGVDVALLGEVVRALQGGGR